MITQQKNLSIFTDFLKTVQVEDIEERMDIGHRPPTIPKFQLQIYRTS